MDPTERFSSLVQGPEDGIALDEAALLVAAHAYPALDLSAELRLIDDLASGCPSTLEGWRRHVFVELGFTGDAAEYYDPRNSFLNQVIRRRRGIPITLAVVGMALGRRAGVALAGVGMPGHFLLRHLGEPAAFVDPFDRGRFLDEAGCEERFRAVHGPEAPFLASYLDPVGTRAILARILANLRNVFARRRDHASLAWVLRLRLAIPGTPAEERAELGAALAATGRFAEAARELEALSGHASTDRADDLARQAVALRARLN